MLVGGVVVEDDVDHLAGRHLGLDRVQEAHELLMAVALHVAADDGPVEDVERSEQGRGAMALVVVRHGAEPALLQRQARLGAIESLDLALLMESAAEYLPDARWQRCMVHFYRNIFSHVPATKVREVSHMLKAIHSQENRNAADRKARAIVEGLRAGRMNTAADLVERSVH